MYTELVRFPVHYFMALCIEYPHKKCHGHGGEMIMGRSDLAGRYALQVQSTWAMAAAGGVMGRHMPVTQAGMVPGRYAVLVTVATVR